MEPRALNANPGELHSSREANDTIADQAKQRFVEYAGRGHGSNPEAILAALESSGFYRLKDSADEYAEARNKAGVIHGKIEDNLQRIADLTRQVADDRRELADLLRVSPIYGKQCPKESLEALLLLVKEIEFAVSTVRSYVQGKSSALYYQIDALEKVLLPAAKSEAAQSDPELWRELDTQILQKSSALHGMLRAADVRREYEQLKSQPPEKWNKLIQSALEQFHCSAEELATLVRQARARQKSEEALSS